MTSEIRRDPGWQFGVALFAGVLMVMAGAFDLIQGLVGIFANDVIMTDASYIFGFSSQTWGWIHTIVGLALIVVGSTLITGNRLARVLGIGLVGLSALTNFMSIPYAPIWSLLLIAIDIIVIWSLAAFPTEPEVV